jgi:hypothetical protein
MAKKQTRRSVSLSKETYNLLKAKCDKEGVTMSGVVSQLIDDYLAGNLRPSSPPKAEELDEEDDTMEAAEAAEPRHRGGTNGTTRFVVNTDLIVTGPESEQEAEQLIASLVQRLVKKGEIAEALVLSADPE